MKLAFESDQVKVKTGNIDNGAQVTFLIGEYQLNNIKDLVGQVDKVFKVSVEIVDQ